MMDAENIVSNYQSLVAAAGAILSDYSIDLGAADSLPSSFQSPGTPFSDFGRGREIHAFAKVTTDVDSAADNVTCQCAIVMADNAALSSNLTVLYETPAIAQSVLVRGYEFRLGTVPGGITKRYLGLRYTTAVADATAGIVFAGFLVNRGTVRVTSASA